MNKLLNTNLVANDRMSGVRNISKYLFIFLKALRKLNRYHPEENRKFLYRCINTKVQLNYDTFDKKKIPYVCGENKIFWAFTSASTNPQTSFKFLGKNNSNRYGTIFSLTGDIWGYDISLFNVYNEEEILIEPEREIIVEESIPPINEIIYVRCQIKKTPLVLENIYKQINNQNIINNNMLNFNNTNNNNNIINNDLVNNNNIDNYIIAKINIKDEDINKKIKILSSYEESIRANPCKFSENDIYKNEDQIKQCTIKINNEKIPFNYYYKFKSKGEYTIKYSFKNILKSLCFMFEGCELITNINGMFYGCSSLTNINLSNFNTNNVTDMNGMFAGCSSLTNINLSNFNTNNVTNMYGMFYGCSSLTNINLSNFNTNKVTNMSCMFYGCSSLTNIL